MSAFLIRQIFSDQKLSTTTNLLLFWSHSLLLLKSFFILWLVGGHGGVLIKTFGLFLRQELTKSKKLFCEILILTSTCWPTSGIARLPRKIKVRLKNGLYAMIQWVIYIILIHCSCCKNKKWIYFGRRNTNIKINICRVAFDGHVVINIHDPVFFLNLFL